MQIILLDKVVNLGNLGEIVKVKDGYARNFLIPSGRARRATEANKAEFEARRVELEKAAAAKLAEAQAQGEKLAGAVVKITQKAGVDGRLFGSVTNHDIAEELNKAGYGLAKAQIRMPNGPIKTVSESTVAVALHTDVVVEVTVSVYGETAYFLSAFSSRPSQSNLRQAAFLFLAGIWFYSQDFLHLPTTYPQACPMTKSPAVLKIKLYTLNVHVRTFFSSVTL